MSDQDELVRDDAPITSSKTAEPDRELSSEAVTIARPTGELYAFWRDVDNLPKFVENLAGIEKIDDQRSRWTVKAPGGKTVSWESVITDDQPGKSISWQSAEGADVPNSGKVEFRDAGQRGSVVRALIAYDPPGGIIGKIVAKMFQREPRIQSRRDLRRFKQLMETGEISTSARNPAMQAEQESE
jgi:uncharacterized membrane protein